MSGIHLVIPELQVFGEITLLHMVHVHAKRPFTLPGPVQPLGPYTPIHLFQHAAVDAGIVAAAQIFHMGQLHAGHGVTRGGHKFTGISPDPWQVARPVKLETLVIVQNAGIEVAGQPGAGGEVLVDPRLHTDLIEQKAVGPTQNLVVARPYRHLGVALARCLVDRRIAHSFWLQSARR